MMYPYYPGCTLNSTGKEYDQSFKAVCSKLDIELKDVKNWICCGASPAHSSSKLLALALPIQNLAEIEKQKYDEVVVPCIGCYSRFKKSIYEIEKDPELYGTINGIIGYNYSNNIKVLNPLEIFTEEIMEDLRDKIVKDLSNLKMVCYYGCVLNRPPKIMQFDESEYPVVMDNMLKGIGINTLDWSCKTECCGVMLALTEPDIIIRLANNILEDAAGVGADAIVVACPLCYANLDTRQAQVNKIYNKDYNIPILYFTQVLGLALGYNKKELGLQKHFVKSDQLLNKIVNREF